MAGIFISYRRGDSAGHAGRLFDRLRANFGADNVFMDVSDIEPGVDFARAIDLAVNSCDALLAIVGAEWAEVENEKGVRRLDDPNDFVRLELAAALKSGKRVIPVLVRGAKMPSESALPIDLGAFASRQAVEVTDARWDSDVAQLTAALEKAVPSLSRSTTVAKPPRRLFSMAAIAAAVLLGGAAWWLMQPEELPLSLEARQSLDQKKTVALESTAPAEQQESQALEFAAPAGGTMITLPYRVSNVSPKPLTIGQVALEGKNASDFSVDASECTGRPVTQGKECRLQVRFRPTGDGERKAWVVVHDDHPGSPWRIKLSGQGHAAAQAEAELSAQPRALAFRGQTVGDESEPQTLIVLSDGEGPVTSLDFGVIGEHQEDFRIERRCEQTTLARGERCELRIKFAPTEPGLRNAALSFGFYGRHSPLIVKLSGIGQMPGPVGDSAAGVPVR